MFIGLKTNKYNCFEQCGTLCLSVLVAFGFVKSFTLSVAA